MPRFAITCEGMTPLLMHNGRLIDPLDPIVKKIREVNSKTAKTDEDYHEISHLEWIGGMYYEASMGPYVPAPNLQKSIVEGARMTKDGKKVERGVFIENVTIPLQYPGPRDVEQLWEDKRFLHRSPVRIGMNRVMRSRPVFNEWRIEATGFFDPSVINFVDLANSLRSAGTHIGLCDYRPTYGRYNCEIKEIAS